MPYRPSLPDGLMRATDVMIGGKRVLIGGLVSIAFCFLIYIVYFFLPPSLLNQFVLKGDPFFIAFKPIFCCGFGDVGKGCAASMTWYIPRPMLE